MCGSMNDVLGLGKLEKFSTCWSHAGAHCFSGLSGPKDYWSRAELQEEIAKQCMQERQMRSQ